MTDKQGHVAKGNRIYWMDNLKTIIIILVILYHAGGVYESTGMWAFFWLVDDPATNTISGILNLVVDIFMMATLFLISGYLAPASMKNKTGGEFLRGKLKRLMIRWVMAVFTLIPL